MKFDTNHILLYGASDDLVELESDELSEEWSEGEVAFRLNAGEHSMEIFVGFGGSGWLVDCTAEGWSAAFGENNVGDELSEDGWILHNVGRPDRPEDPGVRILREDGSEFEVSIVEPS